MPKTKEQVAEYNRAYQAANKDRIAAQRSSYRDANKAAINSAKKEHYKKNRELIAEKRLEKYSSNNEFREKEKERAIKWNQENKKRRSEIMAAHYASESGKLTHRLSEQRRRALKAGSGGKLSPGLAAKLFKLQRGKCACGCAQPLGKDYHMDHRMPLALGGSNTDDNIQLLRQRCNNQKHAKHPIEFMQQRGFLL